MTVVQLVNNNQNKQLVTIMGLLPQAVLIQKLKRLYVSWLPLRTLTSSTVVQPVTMYSCCFGIKMLKEMAPVEHASGA
jgi:hypothetical protein